MAPPVATCVAAGVGADDEKLPKAKRSGFDSHAREAYPSGNPALLDLEQSTNLRLVLNFSSEHTFLPFLLNLS